MLTEKESQQLLGQLVRRGCMQVPVAGFLISIALIKEASQLSLTTVVYEGGNYIPPSVRQCASRGALNWHVNLLTFLSIDEARFQVKLHYLGQADMVDSDALLNLVQEFSCVADQWRVYLDDHDQQDLVYVRVK